MLIDIAFEMASFIAPWIVAALIALAAEMVMEP